MKFELQWRIGLVFAVLLISACDRLPGSASVAVLDLVVIAKATSHDTAMQQQMDGAREELNTQLTTLRGNLETQLDEEREKIGDSASEAQQVEYRQLAEQAQQQFAQSQTRAQQQAQQFQADLVKEYRQTVQDVATEIAASRGAKMIVVSGEWTLWFDEQVDITDEVIAVMRAMPSATPAGGGNEAAAPAAAVPETAVPEAKAPEAGAN